RRWGAARLDRRRQAARRQPHRDARRSPDAEATVRSVPRGPREARRVLAKRAWETGVMSLVRPITRRDIKGPARYTPIRDDYRRKVIELKKPRRVIVGDRVALVFENRHTLTTQIEEMCRAENLTSDAQIEAEIAVYNEMMPTEDSLSATLFIELPPDADP